MVGLRVKVEIDKGGPLKVLEVDVKEGTMISDLFRHMGLVRESYIATINGRLIPDHVKLKNGDTIRLVRVSSGG